jgi:hypothetical protein
MDVTAGGEITHFRYRAPNGGEILGVHEAARRAGEILAAKGAIIEAALITAEYHAALANREGVGELTRHLTQAASRGSDVEARAEVAALTAVAVNANVIAARLQVYMGALAPEFTRIHPENVADAKRP